MKNLATALFLLTLMLLSACQSGNRTVDNTISTQPDYFQEAEKMLSRIEKKAQSEDIEKYVEELVAFCKEKGIELGELVTSTGKEVTQDWLNELTYDSWVNEILATGEKIARNLESLSEDDLVRYTKNIKTYAEKLGLNVFDTISLIADYLKEEAVEFSKGDLLKQLVAIWSDL